ncbi:MAG: hypothetical protein COU33_01585 [Candidatus Magasanikbacteria bacterium CG10_big_fil_rev_8_21_14_0_10_43_6]|uniref:Uncharacterized protein n=1 Tax=Candidatus Magasanikbacteria bacterium CG10_big_fil_rev_8_21_14_0_10_43_6 TaxID=1974650 RepID=A0A2M6W1X7_9BACT|nr:MAG: hypothetical protein COU33_01585 [Candidatus Magasanikbacteria bacterium CG10_big_fil_rev_8_21_14_0_10_43_6]
MRKTENKQEKTNRPTGRSLPKKSGRANSFSLSTTMHQNTPANKRPEINMKAKKIPSRRRISMIPLQSCYTTAEIRRSQSILFITLNEYSVNKKLL